MPGCIKIQIGYRGKSNLRPSEVRVDMWPFEHTVDSFFADV